MITPEVRNQQLDLHIERGRGEFSLKKLIFNLKK